MTIPSVVDADVYRPRSERTRGPVRVGWTGSATTVPNLNMIAPALRQIAERTDVSLRFIGTSHPPIPGLRCELRPWRAETEASDLRALDIGLLPLPSTEWNKRKFYLKLAQYMALGIPAVCTPLGSALDAVDHGVTGFLAESEEDWVRYLEKLIDDEQLRATMGAEAARRGQAQFTLQANVDRIVQTFRSAVA